MRIRNKFAHVKSINSFEYLFLENSCKDILKKLDDWYLSKHLDLSELKFRDLFFQLFSDIKKTLIQQILVENRIAKDVEESYNNHKNKLLRLLDILIAENHNSEFGIELYLKAVKDLDRHLWLLKEED